MSTDGSEHAASGRVKVGKCSLIFSFFDVRYHFCFQFEVLESRKVVVDERIQACYDWAGKGGYC